MTTRLTETGVAAQRIDEREVRHSTHLIHNALEIDRLLDRQQPWPEIAPRREKESSSLESFHVTHSVLPQRF